MNNMKIKVNSEAESEDAQCLFFELGYRWLGGHGSSYFKINDNFKYITAYMRGMSLAQGTNGDAKKEITMLHLRDMVVLKRNDVGDATHGNLGDQKGYLTCENVEYFWDYFDKEWNKVSLTFIGQGLKPITKEPVMKEFLNKLTDGTYKLVLLDSVANGVDGLIEVPEGATSYNQYTRGAGDNEFFIKLVGDTYCFANEDTSYTWEWYGGSLKGHEFVLWQRETQSEALPFIDDEPKYDPEDIGIAKDYDLDELAKEYKLRDRCDGETDEEYRYMLKHCIDLENYIAKETLNDKVASAEVARQESKEWDLGDYAFAESDALIESNVEQSSIVKTLAERQSIYGDFSKVAEMTQGLLFVMSQYGYNDMPDTHKESIHMIASKLARIVNGDHNFIESWHDISGYAILIENELRATDGATNSRLTYQKAINGKLQDI